MLLPHNETQYAVGLAQAWGQVSGFRFKAEGFELHISESNHRASGLWLRV